MDGFLAALPAVNAALNSLSACFLTLGYVLVRRRKLEAHRKAMLTASAITMVFFISYVTKTAFHGTTLYGGTGAARAFYLTVLFSHLTLAIAVVPLAAVTLVTGLKRRFDRHGKIARWTLPIWLYVSVTGVLIYFLLRPWY